MTQEEKNKIYQLSKEGFNYIEIAIKLSKSKDSIRMFLARHPLSEMKVYCEQCGCEMIPLSGNRIKRFCSNKCRNKYWSHQRYHEEKHLVEHTCIECGKVFLSYKFKNRKYCSLTCYRNLRKKLGEGYEKQ